MADELGESLPTVGVPIGVPESFTIYRKKRTTPEIMLTVYLVLTARRWRGLMDEKLRPMGQSSARMEALSAILNSHGPSSQIDIAKRLRIEGPTMTRMLDSLDRDGLVQRHAAPGDRRTKHLTITPRGEEVLADIFAVSETMRARLLDGVPPEQIEAMNSFFAGLLAKLDRGLPDDSAAS